MLPSFLQKVLYRRKLRHGVQERPSTATDDAADRKESNSLPVLEKQKQVADQSFSVTAESKNSPPAIEDSSLFAFVDLKDPFAAGEIAGEQFPGPILSIMSARKFGSLFLFFTPHTRDNALATAEEITRRYAKCRVTAHELPVSDPKDYSSLMGSLCRYLRDLAIEKSPIAKRHAAIQQQMSEIYALRANAEKLASESNYVCVSSGTAEMRAAWFLVTALGILPAKLLQVGSPAYPLFGEANVKEVRIDTTDWETLRNLVMPQAYFGLDTLTVPTASKMGSRSERKMTLETNVTAEEAIRRALSAVPKEALRTEGPLLHRLGTKVTDEEAASRREFVSTPVPGLDEGLQELGIYVGSAVLRHAAERAGIAAGSQLPVLLLGETGTGKERFAHLIHRLSPRFRSELVCVNCAAIPKELAESYLFGHMKGAFTGATVDKKGMFEHAHESTLFLDEIADLTLEVQAKLLRVIQDGVVLRVGSMTPRQVDVRIVAATNRDLRSDVAAGRFREDLYFRLEVVQIKLPALRDRRHEIPELALALLKRINQRRQRPHQLSKAALQRLESYAWPGNVRQLSNVLERSVLYARADVVDADDLLIADDDSPAQDSLAKLPEPSQGFKIEDYLSQARKQLFLRALEKCNGNQSEAAALLGVSRQAVSKFVGSESDNPN
jgi:two-component system response regulator PilR (NtrC family)